MVAIIYASVAEVVNRAISDIIAFVSDRRTKMGLARNEAELARRASAYLKGEVVKADITYEELAKRMKKHGLSETKASVTNKLARGTFPATFLLGAVAALELDGVRLEDV
jgi:hypothetical protein